MTIRNYTVSSLAAAVVAIAAGIIAFAAFNVGGGGGASSVAEAHTGARSLIGYNIPNGTQIRLQPTSILTPRISDGGGGCTVTFPAGAIPIPAGATTVAIPAGTELILAEANCDTDSGAVSLGSSTFRGFLIGSVTATVAHASARIHEEPHGHSVAYATSTGFYCGRLYRWSEFEPGENRPLFLTAARRSLMGWVWVTSSGQQVAQCAGGRQIFRPANR